MVSLRKLAAEYEKKKRAKEEKRRKAEEENKRKAEEKDKKKEVEKEDEKKKKALTASAGESDWWDRFSTKLTGPLSSSKDPTNSEFIFKISRNVFNYICLLVKGDLAAETPYSSSGNPGKALSAEDQVAIALRRLISGESLEIVGRSFGIKQHANVKQVILRFVESMEKHASHHLVWPNSEEMERIKSKFQVLCGLPNCCGASTCIKLKLSATKTKQNHSMILQAVVDPDFRFRDVSISSPWDLNEPPVSNGLIESKLNGKPMELLEGAGAVREYIVGDEGHPMHPWLLTPYKSEKLSDHELDFNRRMRAATMVAKKALSRLKEMFKFLKIEAFRPDKHRQLQRIIFMCFLIHNIIVDLEGNGAVDDEMPLCLDVHHHADSKEWSDAECRDGMMLRDKLAEWLCKK